MNKYTERAYDFFARDPEAKQAVKDMLIAMSYGPKLAENLEEYSKQLSRMEWLAIFRAIQIDVTDAVDWKEVAYMLIADEFNVPPVATDSIPEYDERFDSNDQGD